MQRTSRKMMWQIAKDEPLERLIYLIMSNNDGSIQKNKRKTTTMVADEGSLIILNLKNENKNKSIENLRTKT